MRLSSSVREVEARNELLLPSPTGWYDAILTRIPFDGELSVFCLFERYDSKRIKENPDSPMRSWKSSLDRSKGCLSPGIMDNSDRAKLPHCRQAEPPAVVGQGSCQVPKDQEEAPSLKQTHYLFSVKDVEEYISGLYVFICPS